MTNSTYVNSDNSVLSSDELSFEFINHAEKSHSKSKDKSPLQTIKEHHSSKIFQTEQEETNKGPWSKKEDKLLFDWIKKNGEQSWHECARFISGRTGKQCREHWKNCLNPELKKGEWTLEEDLLIMLSYTKYKGSWREMIHLFEGRTENSIKNRFFSQLRKIALNDWNNYEKKRSSKFNLDFLLKYLEQGIKSAKLSYMRKNRMNQEEFKKYLNQLELRMKKSRNKKNNKNVLEKKNKGSRIKLLGKKREKKSCEKKLENIITKNIISNIKTNIGTNNKLIEIDNEETKKENDNNIKLKPIKVVDDINNDSIINNQNDYNDMNESPKKLFKFFDSNKDIKLNNAEFITPLFETESNSNNNNYFSFLDDDYNEEEFMLKRSDSETLAKIFSGKFSPNFDDSFHILGER